MKIKAVLFDMDGVLVNSEHIMLESAIEMLRVYGVEATEEDFKPFIGSGEISYLGGAAGRHGLSYDPKMTEISYRIYENTVKKRNIAYPNAVSTVKALRKNGIKCAVCTSADREKLRINLSCLGLNDGFDALITGQDIKSNKPSPEIYQKGAEALHIPPENCVVIEDAVNGILSAKAAKMTNIALTTTFTKEELIAHSNPDYIVSSVEDILDIISQINNED